LADILALQQREPKLFDLNRARIIYE